MTGWTETEMSSGLIPRVVVCVSAVFPDYEENKSQRYDTEQIIRNVLLYYLGIIQHARYYIIVFDDIYFIVYTLGWSTGDINVVKKLS